MAANEVAVLEAPVNGRTEGLSFEEFLEKADGKFAEWVDGTMMYMMACSDEHQNLQRVLLSALSLWVEVHDLGEVRGAPMLMKIESRPSGREPDIMFVAKKNKNRIRPTFIDGPADLVIEIVSPESRERDRGEKFYEYETAGVREYWLLDPQRKRAEFYVLNDDGAYQMAQLENGIYRSAVLDGCPLEEAWMWQKPLPKLLDILREWKLV